MSQRLDPASLLPRSSGRTEREAKRSEAGRLLNVVNVNCHQRLLKIVDINCNQRLLKIVNINSIQRLLKSLILILFNDY